VPTNQRVESVYRGLISCHYICVKIKYLFTDLSTMAGPFLKWAGGKRQLLDEIRKRIPADISEIDTYIEPFVGGGSVLFWFLENFDLERVIATDLNNELIQCYVSIRDNHESVAGKLISLVEEYPQNKDGQREFFYRIREIWNSGVGEVGVIGEDALAERSAQTIFLNKTCFNGLFRVNKKGLFNVPCNYTKKPAFPSKSDLEVVSLSLQNVEFESCSYLNCEKYGGTGSFFYFDPPYRPLSKTSGFVSYSSEDFSDEDQKELAELFRRLDSIGSKVLLSNSDPRNTNPEDNFFDDIYDGYNIERINAKRSINSVGNRRGEITEILVNNYRV